MKVVLSLNWLLLVLVVSVRQRPEYLGMTVGENVKKEEVKSDTKPLYVALIGSLKILCELASSSIQ